MKIEEWIEVYRQGSRQEVVVAYVPDVKTAELAMKEFEADSYRTVDVLIPDGNVRPRLLGKMVALSTRGDVEETIKRRALAKLAKTEKRALTAVGVLHP